MPFKPNLQSTPCLSPSLGRPSHLPRAYHGDPSSFLTETSAHEKKKPLVPQSCKFLVSAFDTHQFVRLRLYRSLLFCALLPEESVYNAPGSLGRALIYSSGSYQD